MTSGWRVEHAHGSAGVLHGRALSPPVERTMWLLEVDRPAVVLGSTQPDAIVDRAAADAAGVEIVRRRSGGGAVLLEPGGAWWVDLVIPRGDPCWHDDVGVAAAWVGEAWRSAVATVLDAPTLSVHAGAMVHTEWSRLVCFAGVGPGEVMGRRPGGGLAKVVGIAQRRTRYSATFQCALHRRWDPAALVRLLDLAPAERARAEAALAVAAWEVPADPARLEAALLDALPSG
ncbi:MAG TPA: hypothetical protein VHA73_03620 [Acidimicrobiales bacterium]|nr:hypothetical protein [Acidimicrobiales bacterium]